MSGRSRSTLLLVACGILAAAIGNLASNRVEAADYICSRDDPETKWELALTGAGVGESKSHARELAKDDANTKCNQQQDGGKAGAGCCAPADCDASCVMFMDHLPCVASVIGWPWVTNIIIY